jgi:Methyltransferase domain
MDSPQIHPQGYWLSYEEGHFFDDTLAQELGLLLRGKSVCDFGCGPGKYVHWLRKIGLECDGYDGNPNTNALSLGACHPLNLAEPVHLQKRYDVVISLEVAEHIPMQYESIFLDNLARHAREMIVLSWAVPGQLGDGHVNCRMNVYAIYQLWRRGFQIRPTLTVSLRNHCSLPWFAHTLMVFSRSRKPHSPGEIRAAARIFSQDINRLNRSNSHLAGASIGKLCRLYSQFKSRLEKTRRIAKSG